MPTIIIIKIEGGIIIQTPLIRKQEAVGTVITTIIILTTTSIGVLTVVTTEAVITVTVMVVVVVIKVVGVIVAIKVGLVNSSTIREDLTHLFNSLPVLMM